jgi:release factor glutamine methyltransferase
VSPQKWIIKDLLEVTAEYLKKKDIDSPRLCAEILLAFQLKTTRIKLYLNFDQPVGEKDLNEFRAFIQRRLNREPVQYITGVQEFWSREFMVNPKVLIPRPETEVLVEQAFAVLNQKKEGEVSFTPRILDIGTGSGAIAVSLAGELSDADVWASDVSEDALETARANARKHNVEEKIHFVKSDLFSAIDPLTRFDAIVSNPPYVALEDLDNLQPEVGRYEPRSALDGGPGGLVIVNKLILEAKDYLKPGGWLLMEMDPSQTAKAAEIIEKSGHYGEKKVVKDYSRCDRVVMTQRL